MPTTLDQATKFAWRGGKVLIVGGFDEGYVSSPLEWQRIQMSEIKLIPSASFSFWGLDAEQGTVRDLFGKRRVDGRAYALVTARWLVQLMARDLSVLDRL
ncbi:MAG TPA: hypothetical protein VG944_19260 [Fimbriimonas sp.]|nr:hypothetical protein [Fimbriimonas sp.]